MFKTRAVAALMAGEQFHVAQEQLSFSPEKVELTAEPGEVVEGSFAVSGPQEVSVGGFVASSRQEMKALTETISGARDTVGYRFDGSGLSDGDVVEGIFRIISNQGEYEVPYTVRICGRRLVSPQGPVESLFHFTNLAKADWKEAVGLFYRPEFVTLFSDREKEEAALWRGLSAHPGNEQNVEEFLIAAGQKQAAVFLPEPQQFRLEVEDKGAGERVCELTIARSGWGYTHLEAEADGDFLRLSKTLVTEEDVLQGEALQRDALQRDALQGGTAQEREGERRTPERAEQPVPAAYYSLRFAIDLEKLHEGRNFGALRFKAPFHAFEVPVEVFCRRERPSASSRHAPEKGQVLIALMQGYEEFRARRLPYREWLAQAGALIERLRLLDPGNPYTALYQAHLLVTAGKKSEARRELEALLEKITLREQMARAQAAEVMNGHGIVNGTAQGWRERGAGQDAALQTEWDVAQETGWLTGRGAAAQGHALRPRAAQDGFSIPTVPGGEALALLARENPTAYCYERYLEALASEEEPAASAQAAAAIEEQWKRDPGNWRIAWLLMYLSDHYRKRPSAKWNLLREQFSYGAHSPVLYIEAYALIAVNPAIVGRLEEFELQTLLYAAKHGLLTAGVMTQLNMLSRGQRVFLRKLLKILIEGYAMEELRDETLESICTLLVKGNVTDSRYFVWYQRGVEAQVRVTRLYEYYMLSLPEDFDGALPQSVLLYFCYQNTLPYDRAAYLYRYVHERRQEQPELYRYYEPEIVRFVMTQLAKGRAGRDLGYLYGVYLNEKTIGAQNAAAAARALFACIVRTSDSRAVKLVLRYEHSEEEEIYAVRDGVCCLPVYGEENRIFFEDAAGNRYAESVPYHCDRVHHGEALVELLSRFDTGVFPFDLYLSGRNGEAYGIGAQNSARFLALARSEKVAAAYRQVLRLRLLHFYNDHDCIQELDEFLGELEPAGLKTAERAELIRFLALRGIYDKALDWLRRYGTQGVEGERLLRVVGRVLSREEGTADEGLTAIVYRTFALGKYDEPVLYYLSQHFEGLTRELDAVRRAMGDFGMDAAFLAGRMLRQMLYSGLVLDEQAEIFAQYRAGGADPELAAAVLAQSAHAYFICRRPIAERLIAEIGRLGRDGMALLDICRIAYVRYFAGQEGELPPRAQETLEAFLNDLCGRGVVFPFFRRFLALTPRLSVYADQTLLQYRGPRGAHVCIHYALEREDGGVPPYETRVMKEMYEGVYVTGFVLFFGEQLRYYITQDEQEQEIEESGVLGQDGRMDEEEAGRFGRLNRISTAVTMRDYGRALEELSSYDRLARTVMGLFAQGRGDAER